MHFDAEAFADGQGSMIAGMVNMVSAASCTAIAEDGYAHALLQSGREYEWGNWTIMPSRLGSGDGNEVGLIVRNRKLSRSPYCVSLAADGAAVFIDSRGGSHNLC